MTAFGVLDIWQDKICDLFSASVLFDSSKDQKSKAKVYYMRSRSSQVKPYRKDNYGF